MNSPQFLFVIVESLVMVKIESKHTCFEKMDACVGDPTL